MWNLEEKQEVKSSLSTPTVNLIFTDGNVKKTITIIRKWSQGVRVLSSKGTILLDSRNPHYSHMPKEIVTPIMEVVEDLLNRKVPNPPKRGEHESKMAPILTKHQMKVAMEEISRLLSVGDQDQLYRKAAAKALNIPLEEVEIDHRVAVKMAAFGQKTSKTL